jgi:hypothetical protein
MASVKRMFLKIVLWRIFLRQYRVDPWEEIFNFGINTSTTVEGVRHIVVVYRGMMIIHSESVGIGDVMLFNMILNLCSLEGEADEILRGLIVPSSSHLLAENMRLIAVTSQPEEPAASNLLH